MDPPTRHLPRSPAARSSAIIRATSAVQSVARQWIAFVIKTGSYSTPLGASMRIRICLLMFMGLLALAGCGKAQSTDELIEDLKSADEEDRIKAARLLQHRKGDAAEVVPALIESLKDVDPDVRWSAAIGLGYFGAEAETALPALDKAQSDTDPRVREGARVAISRIGGKK